MIERQSLATGFRNVDTSGDTDACQRCLDTIAGIPFFRDVKRESIRIIADTRPHLVLDAGCGSGIDLPGLAATLPASAHIVGLDASTSLLARAAERTAEIRGRCSLVRGDMLKVPFHKETFDACRIDRVLQHIRRPEYAVRELARILIPNGILVAFDNDWDTFSINIDDRDLASRFTRFWRDSFASGRVGKDLPGYFRACGLTDIHAEPRVLQLNNLTFADQIFDIPYTLRRAEETGVLDKDDTDSIMKELIRNASEKNFICGYTGYLVTGKKTG